jgi:hypothetical protein
MPVINARFIMPLSVECGDSLKGAQIPQGEFTPRFYVFCARYTIFSFPA